MALIQCRTCGAQISSATTVCKGCPRNPLSLRLRVFWSVLLGIPAIIFALTIYDDAINAYQTQLNFNKPIFTKSGSLMCPVSLISDLREGGGTELAHSALTAISFRKKEAEKIGCIALRRWLGVSALPLPNLPPGDLIFVTLTAYPELSYITVASELTNAVPPSDPF